MNLFCKKLFSLKCIFNLLFISLFLKRFYLFLDGGEGWKKERERNIDV